MFNHWCLFVLAMSILLSDSISPENLVVAAFCLTKFYSEFARFYGFLFFFFLSKEEEGKQTNNLELKKENNNNNKGERYLSINIHHSKHLVFLTKKLGPLWAVSCFPFESMNHLLRKLIHGNTHVLSQVSDWNKREIIIWYFFVSKRKEKEKWN